MALVLRVAALAALAVAACAPSDDFEIASSGGGTAGSVGGTGAKDAGSGGVGALGGVGASGGVGALGGVGASGGVGGSGGVAGAAGASGGTAGASGGASGAAGSGTIPTCDALFTGVVGVNQVCTEESGKCVLAADTDALDGDPGQTCGAICAAAGSECVQVFDNGIGGYCTPNTAAPLQCTTADQTNAVCYCSRGCGGGPPCATGTKCSSGQCV